jgi:hypothetical protein
MTDEEYIQLGKLISKAINELKKTTPEQNNACPFCRPRQRDSDGLLTTHPYWITTPLIING